jgi:glycosyltransferase involved in cell wall biosynthesis
MSPSSSPPDPASGSAPRAAAVSVVINTLNEEHNIVECIASVRGFADEIVVCDMESDDRTVELAKAHGARVVSHPRAGFVEPARRYAIAQAGHPWVLVLDADERMTAPLAARLREVAAAASHDVVAFWSLYWYFGGWVRHGAFFTGQWRRFFRRQAYLDTYSASDEQVHHNFESLARAARILQLPREYYIRHYAYPTVEKYIAKTLGRYALIEAEQYVGQGRRFSLLRMIGEPVKELGARYLLRRGYRDGMRGFILACLFAGYRFSVWANVWYLEKGRDDAGR